MTSHRLIQLAVLFLPFLTSTVFCAFTASPRQLSFEDRVAAQEAIERVYYSHQIDASRPVEEAVPRQMLERKVLEYLRQSMELEASRGRPISEQELREELARIEAATHFPDRLLQIYESLEHDHLVILECFVRPVMVGRRSNADPGDSISLDTSFQMESGDPGCIADDTWDSTTISGGPSARYDHSAVWTGNLLLVWGGTDGVDALGTGGRYDPVTDSWTAMSLVGAPTARLSHTVVWTGSEMIAWGGSGSGSIFGDGARYEPVADVWSPVSGVDAPAARNAHTAVWTGDLMIVWGGNYFGTVMATGGAYRPSTDSWQAASTVGAPSARQFHAAVWADDELIIWGGYAPFVLPFYSTGGRYNPSSDVWLPTATANAPSGRADASIVWTGTFMVVWGGDDSSITRPNTGARYVPASDVWTSLNSLDAPSARTSHSTVWTGEEMIVWGGYGGSGIGHLDTGSRYDPLQNTWSPMSTTGAPSPRAGHSGTLAEDLLLVWGGIRPAVMLFDDGGRYGFGQPDDDGDGSPACADCDDNDPLRYPGAAEVCDGLDNDCDGSLPLDEVDDDADGFSTCAGDCDDAAASRFPGNPEICDNVDNDCDSTIDDFGTSCGVGACAGAGTCVAGIDDCAPGSPQSEVCNGVDDDCNGVVPPEEIDLDLDGVAACAGDCDPQNGNTFPGADEVLDSVDNQCTGDPGFGSIDEISGVFGFFDSASPDELCWTAQAGAAAYEIARSADASLEPPCALSSTSEVCWEDVENPPAGQAFHYLVRSSLPLGGSWGQGPAGDRGALCGSEECTDGIDNDGDGWTDCQDLADCFRRPPCQSATFSFQDLNGDDLSPTALHDFFTALSLLPGDYVHFRIDRTFPPVFEWCAERADAYRDAYLFNAASGGTMTSAGWAIWHRTADDSWIGPEVAGLINYYGSQCFGAYSWCSEVGLSGHAPTVDPGDAALCEARDAFSGCGDPTWTLSISVGTSRWEACGF